MTLYDKLAESIYDKEELSRLLLLIDSWLKYLHYYGFYIYDFNPKKIVLENGTLTFNSFRYVRNDIGNTKNMPLINIYELSQIGIMAYHNSLVSGHFSQEFNEMIHNEMVNSNNKPFKNGNIPEEILEYYEEIFINGNVSYMNDYLKQKNIEKQGESNALRKRKTTEIGVAYEEKEAAFVNILFIPGILILGFILGILIYMVVIKL